MGGAMGGETKDKSNSNYMQKWIAPSTFFLFCYNLGMLIHGINVLLR